MSLIDADTAQPGLTILAKEQTRGKGQRGRKWVDGYAQSILMSIIITPNYELRDQFLFNAAAATAIADTLQSLNEYWDVRIKWPNDIIINDKKAGGVLIENVLRGDRWAYCIIGFGMNVLQEQLPEDLPYATSLAIQSGKNYNVEQLAEDIRAQILRKVYNNTPAENTIQEYNDYLYRKDQLQVFTDADKEWEARIEQVTKEGQLQVLLDNGERVWYTHGSVNWRWT